MNKKVKLAIIALLGFGTACSGVSRCAKDKEASKSTNKEHKSDDTPRLMVMYGVPSQDFEVKDKVQPEKTTDQPTHDEETTTQDE